MNKTAQLFKTKEGHISVIPYDQDTQDYDEFLTEAKLKDMVPTEIHLNELCEMLDKKMVSYEIETDNFDFQVQQGMPSVYDTLSVIYKKDIPWQRVRWDTHNGSYCVKKNGLYSCPNQESSAFNNDIVNMKRKEI